MEPDAVFYAQSKLDIDAIEQVGYFCNTSFILTYFNLTSEDYCKFITISREQFAEFVNDLNIEIIHHNVRHNEEPWNNKLKQVSIFSHHSIHYDESYWKSINDVYNWAAEVLNKFHWSTDEIAIYCFL